ncbi:MAG: hypothetical protein K2M05_09235 [Paramuribaculum sp.]|nr:hypothetical protein [Paramuribaculum sp.]MDE6304560.1 hypothetical protein [Paramuribaculum sp.]
MTRKIAVAIILLLLLGGILFALAVFRDPQSALKTSRTDTCVGMLRIVDKSPLIVELENGVRFKLDTGSDLTTIAESDLAVLDSLGYVDDQSIYWNIGRDGADQFNFEEKSYHINLPLSIFYYETDSLGMPVEILQRRETAMMKDVAFAPAKTDFSVLGIDFLKKFVVEYCPEQNYIAFHTKLPDGYEPTAPISNPYNIFKYPWSGSRYYIDFAVDGNANRYFIDTGLQAAHVKLPASDAKYCKRQLYPDKLRSFRDTVDALVDQEAWVTCGSRAGSHSAFYCDDSEEDYSVNIFNVFSQDVVIDFPGHQVCLLPAKRFSTRTTPVLKSSADSAAVAGN